jgi:hypothetical protein
MRLAFSCALSFVLASIYAPGQADAEENRYAILIGSNAGDAGEVLLRYAESDAERVGETLRTLGGFSSGNVTILRGRSPSEVKRVLSETNERIRKAQGDTLLFIFYSGHADAESLHLAGAHLPLGELKALVATSPSAARVLVVDACRSGALTRVKGGRPAPSFDVRVEPPAGATGLAILTSSAAGEDSQESDQLSASFFTHYLVSALMGAADRDQDGRVTLSEAFGYSSDRTLAATVSTLAGPQHPTYRVDLGGRGDLVLTRPGESSRDVGVLVFASAGSYLVHRGANGAVVAELATEAAGARLAVTAGSYEVIRREPTFLLKGRVEVASGATALVDPRLLQRVEYAQRVRKGGADADTDTLLLQSGRGDLQNGVHLETGVFDILIGWYALAYERVLGRHLSLVFEGAFNHRSFTNPFDPFGMTSYQLNGYRLSLAPHVYFFRPAPGGFFISPIVRAGVATIGGGGVSAFGSFYELGGRLGWSWCWSFFNLKLGAGVEYASYSIQGTDSTGETVNAPGTGVTPSFELSIGFLF